jgi:hypothetical protein
MITLTTILQTVIALGIFNVWLIRPKLATGYRGGNAKSLKEEFAVYNLPEWFMYLIGFLKISAALLLIWGINNSHAALIGSALMTILMSGAVLMHYKVQDDLKKTFPAVIMLMLSIVVAVQNI